MNVALRPANPGYRHIDILSLCTGGGGLDLGIELAVPGARSICMVEREAFAVAHLVSAMQSGLLAPAPVWSDARTFDGRRWRGAVDGVIGGIPCQPHSLAGRKRGSLDERDLWSDARRILVQSRAWFCLIENVGGMLSAGADEIAGAQRVWRDLRKLGFAVEIGLFTAAEVGAPHERERLFILGVADCDIGDGDEGRGSGAPGQWSAELGFADGRGDLAYAGSKRGEAWLSGSFRPEQEGIASQPVDSGDALVNAALVGRREGRPEPEFRSGRNAAAGTGQPVDDASRHRGREGRPVAEIGQFARGADLDGAGQSVGDTLRGGHDWRPDGAFGREVERAAVEGTGEHIGVFPPGPADLDLWRWIADRAADLLPAHARHDRFRIEIGNARAAAHGDPAKGTWLDPRGPYGLRAAVVQEIAQSTLRGVAHGLAANRTEWLRLLGNGVVSLEGAYAFRTLATRLAGRGSAGAARLVRMMEAAE